MGSQYTLAVGEMPAKGKMGEMPNDGTLSSQLNKVAVIIAYFQFIDHYPQYDKKRRKATKNDISLEN